MRPLLSCTLENPGVLSLSSHKDDFVVSSFRDPVKRTVSQFAWTFFRVDTFYKNPFDTSLGVYTEPTVANLMEWVNIRESFLSNYQSKLLTYPLTPTKLGMHYSDILFDQYTTTIESVNTHLVDVDLLFRTEQCTNPNKEELKTIIWDEFLIPAEDRVPYTSTISESHSNAVSSDLYNALSPADKSIIANISPIDSEIYETSSLFWKDGVV